MSSLAAVPSHAHTNSIVVTGVINQDFKDSLDASPIYDFFNGTEAGDFSDEYNETVEDREPGFAENLLIGLALWFGDQVFALMDAMNLNLDGIVFGRLITREGKYAPTTFDFDENNFFGALSMMYYDVMGMIVVIVWPMMFAFIIIAGFMLPRRAETLVRFRGSFIWALFFTMILSMAPDVYVAILFMRDILLGLFASIALSVNGGGVFSIIETVRISGELNIVNALLYFGLAFSTIYFAFIYLGISVGIMFGFILLPVDILLAIHPANRELVSGNFKELIANVSTPVIDAAFLGIAIISMNYLPAILTIFIIWTGVTLRSYVKKKYGLSSSMGMELAGFGALMGAMALTRGISGGITRTLAGAKATASNVMADNREIDYLKDSNGSTMGAEPTTRPMGLSSSSLAGASADASATVNVNAPSTPPGIATPTQPMSSAPSQMQSQQGMSDEMFKKHSNYAWLDDPQKSRMLSTDQKIELLKRRRTQTAARGALNAAGGVAGTLGGATAGFVGGAWMGRSASTVMGAAGAAIGGAGINETGKYNDLTYIKRGGRTAADAGEQIIAMAVRANKRRAMRGNEQESAQAGPYSMSSTDTDRVYGEVMKENAQTNTSGTAIPRQTELEAEGHYVDEAASSLYVGDAAATALLETNSAVAGEIADRARKGVGFDQHLNRATQRRQQAGAEIEIGDMQVSYESMMSNVDRGVLSDSQQAYESVSGAKARVTVQAETSLNPRIQQEVSAEPQFANASKEVIEHEVNLRVESSMNSPEMQKNINDASLIRTYNEPATKVADQMQQEYRLNSTEREAVYKNAINEMARDNGLFDGGGYQMLDMPDIPDMSV